MLLSECKMKINYDINDILIPNGFKFGVDFNISCREWDMLRLNHWLTDNVINRALDLLLQRIQQSGQNCWIFNTYTMEYLLLFPHDKHSLGSRLYKNYQDIFLI